MCNYKSGKHHTKDDSVTKIEFLSRSFSSYKLEFGSRFLLIFDFFRL
jgi:hypothetical protein